MKRRSGVSRMTTRFYWLKQGCSHLFLRRDFLDRTCRECGNQRWAHPFGDINCHPVLDETHPVVKMLRRLENR